MQLVAALATSAFLVTMTGALPPNSSEKRLMEVAESRTRSRPACEEPIRVNMAGISLVVSTVPSSRALPATKLITRPEADALHDLADVEGRERRAGGRLDDGRAARGQHRAQLMERLPMGKFQAM